MLGADEAAAADHHGALDHVAQLAHVARPVIALQLLLDLGGEAADLAIVLPVELVDERLGEERDVLAPLAQRRQVDREHVEPVEEVLAQLAVGDRLGRVLVGGGHHAHVDLDLVLAAAHAPEAAFLQHAQQLGLRTR